MPDESTPGIFVRGDDGRQYFIPQSDLSSYVVDVPDDAIETLTSEGAPRLDALRVEQPENEEDREILSVCFGAPPAES